MYKLPILQVQINIISEKETGVRDLLLDDGKENVSNCWEKEVSNNERLKPLCSRKQKSTRGDIIHFKGWNQNTNLMIWSVTVVISFQIKFVYEIT